MFYCQMTGELSRPGERAVKIVVARKSATYGSQKFAHGKRREVVDPGGSGMQIAKEVMISEALAVTLAGMSQEAVESWYAARMAKGAPAKKPAGVGPEPVFVARATPEVVPTVLVPMTMADVVKATSPVAAAEGEKKPKAAKKPRAKKAKLEAGADATAATVTSGEGGVES